MKKELTVGLSNRHIHISQEDLDEIFGEGYELTQIKDLTQPGQFACDEKVDIVGPKGTLSGVRILGPVRPETQIEISMTDAFALGVKGIIRDSGDIEGTPGVKIVGPEGEVEIKEGAMVAGRHIHMHTDDAKAYALKDGDLVSVKVNGPRGLTFDNVLVRVSDNYALEMHLDMEEGNACGARNGDVVEIVG